MNRDGRESKSTDKIGTMSKRIQTLVCDKKHNLDGPHTMTITSPTSVGIVCKKCWDKFCMTVPLDILEMIMEIMDQNKE